MAEGVTPVRRADRLRQGCGESARASATAEARPRLRACVRRAKARRLREFAGVILVGALAWSAATAPATAQRGTPAPPSPWANFVEPDFPFFSSVVDARSLGTGWPADNLTPRGLVLNLGQGLWACFDIDLLRMSAMWTGKGVTPVGMAQGSYHLAGAKAPEGQRTLPQIVGTPWIANGVYPGWQTGATIAVTDPRPAGPDPREVGRGPIDPSLGRFTAVRFTAAGLVLEYEVRGVAVQERIIAGGVSPPASISRRVRLARVPEPLWLVLGRRPAGGTLKASVSGSPAATLVERPGGLLAVRVAASTGPVEFVAAIGAAAQAASTTAGSPLANADVTARPRWPQTVNTRATLAKGPGAYVLDRIALPTTNPWRRNIRLADIAFLGGGRAAAVTFDGDVWAISGLSGELPSVSWRRFASGLHEPLGIVARNGELFVFDRNGIWRLVDIDGNGEADRHELFSNAFVQTAETREFAMSVRLAPDGSFVIAKGGQEGTTIGRDNGSVLRISADGRTSKKLAYGLRQPFAAVHPRTGLVTASDQQGNYVPSTPLHVIRDGQYYGFIPLILPKEQYPAPIADPLLWIPHAINASGAGQVWLTGARMGPLTDALVHLGYFRPEMFLVRMNERGSRLQGAVVSLTRGLDFGPLAGAVNPADGQLYVTGFQIWGTEADQISGLVRYRYTGAPTTLPHEVAAMDKGVLLRFDVPLDAAAAANPANYSAERWNYQRTAGYGSPHFKTDGTRGQDTLTPSSAYVSRDKKTVFIGLPGMQTVMQMRVGWSLKTAAGAAFDHTAYLTPYELTRFNPVAEGFAPVTVDLTPRAAKAAATTPVTAEEGRRLAALMGCVACHSVDGTVTGKTGPSWKGLYGAERVFTDKTKGTADAAYLRQSILEPAARVATGFNQADAGMPSYAGVLTDAQIDALVLYIQSLK
jgi:glucose/arabinose dehydrogenase/mono/diheme cytochrome c family protein